MKRYWVQVHPLNKHKWKYVLYVAYFSGTLGRLLIKNDTPLLFKGLYLYGAIRNFRSINRPNIH